MARCDRAAGFTLLEILIAIVIIGIIGSIAIPQLFGVFGKAKRTSVMADMDAIGKGWLSHAIDSIKGFDGNICGNTAHREIISATHFTEIPVGSLFRNASDAARPYRFGVCLHSCLLQCFNSEGVGTFDADCSGADSRIESGGDVSLTKVIVVSP